MPTTASGIVYPSNSDDVDIPGDMQAMANSVETALGNAGGGLVPFLLMGA